MMMVEFLRLAGIACRAFHPSIQWFIRQLSGEVWIILRTAAFQSSSEEAIQILEAARQQGRFEEVLDTLFGNQPQWASHDSPALEDARHPMEAGGLNVPQASTEMLRLEVT